MSGAAGIPTVHGGEEEVNYSQRIDIPRGAGLDPVVPGLRCADLSAHRRGPPPIPRAEVLVVEQVSITQVGVMSRAAYVIPMASRRRQASLPVASSRSTQP